jgi:HSP20 family molecular chaperone IbpA
MGAFKRFSSLPTRVSYEKADAKFENGVLTIVVPKKEKKKTAKAIKIK